VICESLFSRKIAEKNDSRKLIPKISRIFELAVVSSFKVRKLYFL